MWPRKPKILFVAATPQGRSIPLEQHTQVLLKAIWPWLPPFDPGDPHDLEKKVSQFLTILPNATLEQVEAACSRETFTHIHILAHGMEDESQPGSPYGLALHGGSNQETAEVVSGTRFASALNTPFLFAKEENPLRGRTRLPSVVTVAACDSGYISSVVYSNAASFAHDLHQAGIPFVVASQFPLSFVGSVHMAEVLYENLLWGKDPRSVLHQLRTKLYSLQGAYSHDWASVVAYAALPDDLVGQLKEVQYVQARSAAETAMLRLDSFIDLMARSESRTFARHEQIDSHTADLSKELSALFERVDGAAKSMPTDREYATEGIGLLASIEKQKAEAWYQLSHTVKGQEVQLRYHQQCLRTLRQALRYYEQAVRENLRPSEGVVLRKDSLHWVMGQYLSLRAVLGEMFLRDHWGAAVMSAQLDLSETALEIRAWAHGSLVDLHLVLLAYEQKGLPLRHKSAREKALDHARTLASLVSPDSFLLASAQRQFRRYAQWWSNRDFVTELHRTGSKRERNWSEKGGLIELAQQIVQCLSVR
jgi:hypothetical protein